MYKYLIYWTLLKLIPSSHPGAPVGDAYGNPPSTVVVCDTITFTLSEQRYYKPFSTLDSAKAFKAGADTTKNVRGVWLDSVLVTNTNN
jgi:hypothetical protein